MKTTGVTLKWTLSYNSIKLQECVLVAIFSLQNVECLLLLGHILFADGTLPYCPCDSSQTFFIVGVIEQTGQGFKSSVQPNQVTGFLIFGTLHKKSNQKLSVIKAYQDLRDY